MVKFYCEPLNGGFGGVKNKRSQRKFQAFVSFLERAMAR